MGTQIIKALVVPLVELLDADLSLIQDDIHLLNEVSELTDVPVACEVSLYSINSDTVQQFLCESLLQNRVKISLFSNVAGHQNLIRRLCEEETDWTCVELQRQGHLLYGIYGRGAIKGLDLQSLHEGLALGSGFFRTPDPAEIDKTTVVAKRIAKKMTPLLAELEHSRALLTERAIERDMDVQEVDRLRAQLALQQRRYRALADSKLGRLTRWLWKKRQKTTKSIHGTGAK